MRVRRAHNRKQPPLKSRLGGSAAPTAEFRVTLCDTLTISVQPQRAPSQPPEAGNARVLGLRGSTSKS